MSTDPCTKVLNSVSGSLGSFRQGHDNKTDHSEEREENLELKVAAVVF